MSEIFKVPVDLVTQHITCKRELYEATVRNGFYLPSFKCSLITEDYLLAVANGKIWCPLYKDIRLLPCPRPPSRNVLLGKLSDVLQKMNKNAGINE